MTPAERRAVQLAAQGCTSRQIATRMSTTENSVRQTLHRVYIQIGLKVQVRQRPDREQLAALLASPPG